MAQHYIVRRREGIDHRARDKWEIVGEYVEKDGSTHRISIAHHSTRKSATLAARFIAGHAARVSIEGR